MGSKRKKGCKKAQRRRRLERFIDINGEPLSIGVLWAAENKKYQVQGGTVRVAQTFISPMDKQNLLPQFYQYTVSTFNLPEIMFED